MAKPKKLAGMFETLKDPIYSTAIGLVMYGGGYFTPYEIDSNKKLRYKNEVLEPSKNIDETIEDIKEIDSLKIEKNNKKSEKKSDITDIKKIKKNSGIQEKVSKFWNSITQLF